MVGGRLCVVVWGRGAADVVNGRGLEAGASGATLAVVRGGSRGCEGGEGRWREGTVKEGLRGLNRVEEGERGIRGWKKDGRGEVLAAVIKEGDVAGL